MEMTVSVVGKPTLQYLFATADKTWTPPEAPCRPGQLCQPAAASGCLLLQAVTPVLEYFSEVVSHEPAILRFHAAAITTESLETGQTAACRVLLAAMLHSSCPFFSRISPRFGQDPSVGVYDLFMGMARNMAMLTVLAELLGGVAKPRAQSAAGYFARQLKPYLERILQEARRRRRQDAAVNAVVMLFSCNSLLDAEWPVEPWSTAVEQAATPHGTGSELPDGARDAGFPVAASDGYAQSRPY